MKALVIALTIFSTILTGCDRQTLDGLRLRFQADFKSDYEEQGSEPTSQSQPSTPSQPSQSAPQQEEKWQNQPIREVKSEPNPDDEPPPFRPLEACSKGGIVAQTNKIFYESNPDVKSIDSKNKQQVKEWQKIQDQVQEKCSTSE